MKTLSSTTLLLILLLLSCSNSKINSKENVNITSTQKSSSFDSAANEIYIGFVNRGNYDKSDEININIYPKSNEYHFSNESTDSVIYKDDNSFICRIPLSIARNEFDLGGIEELTIYDESNNELTKAHFVRAVYSENDLSNYLAVYKTDNPKLLDKAVYCIGNLKENLTKAFYTEFKNSKLTNEIVNSLKLTHNYNLNSKHYNDNTTKATISVINYDQNVQIVEKSSSGYNCIYKNNEDENIFRLIFVPIVRNSKPILLTYFGIPESEAEWISVLVYDGTKYIPTDKQRIKNTTTTR
ncbi:MAG: hypothetical protein JXR27_00550 [Paludibacteraceae bacterium]|jgi:hypothetical protein|nr:hypothetical protein [Paludibacteraceae bacterium]